MELSDILEVTDDLTQARWVECPAVPGFAIFLRLPDVPGLRAIVHSTMMESFKAAAEKTGPDGKPAGTIDPGAVGLELSDYAVEDWRGLTGAGLRYFAQGAKNLHIKAAPEVEVPFNRQVMKTLLKWSPRFYEFVDQVWKDLENQGLMAREADEKNSSDAPATTPIPRPNSAAGASKKKKGSK
jgi:hypothetical protein